MAANRKMRATRHYLRSAYRDPEFCKIIRRYGTYERYLARMKQLAAELLARDIESKRRSFSSTESPK